MRILITGGRGFIGSRLRQYLPDADIVDYINGPSVQSLTSLDYDVVFHLAATARVGISLRDPEGVISNNVNSTLRLLELARLNKKTRLIVVSSSSVKHAELSRNPYALSKSICEQMVNTYRESFGVDATSVRLFNVYGPGEADYGNFTTLIKQCKKGMRSGVGFYVEGNGSTIRDFTHVDDVCRGLLDSIDDHRPLIELGSGVASVSVMDIIKTFQEGTTLPCEYRPARIADPWLTCSDPELAPVGWTPYVDVLNYVREWKKNGCVDD